jgi:acyl-CoA synthetase (AMP-forming)/AMP-acid ligase II
MTRTPTSAEATVSSVLREHARSRPDGTATVCGDVRLTWSEFRGRVLRLAGGLHGAGVRQGDRVLWMGQNCHRVVETLAACAEIGAVLCPVNWRQSAAELVFVIPGPAKVARTVHVSATGR